MERGKEGTSFSADFAFFLSLSNYYKLPYSMDKFGCEVASDGWPLVGYNFQVQSHKSRVRGYHPVLLTQDL